MQKKRFRIGTALINSYSKTKKRLSKGTKKSATIRAVANTGSRMKKSFMTMIHKIKNSVKRTTCKADRTLAKKIRSIIKKRR